MLDGWNAIFNGGGASSRASSVGGGATDFRTINGSWDNVLSLRSRLIVAGGGGGTGQMNFTEGNSGTGAGANGGRGGRFSRRS